MVKGNDVISNNHFHKDWQRYVKTGFSQPFVKARRHRNRQKKALKIAPRPAKGPLRPAVQCPSIRYNRKARLGRGFSLSELKFAKINRKFASTIGIAVDHRRRNKCYEGIQKNKHRLEVYMNKLILFPKNANKLQAHESNKEACKRAVQLEGKIMDVKHVKKNIKWLKLEKFENAPSVYKILRDARSATRKHKKSKKNAFKIGEDEK